jgi:SAM-dependent methyltransferase
MTLLIRLLIRIFCKLFVHKNKRAQVKEYLFQVLESRKVNRCFTSSPPPYMLHIGPGPGWIKPNNHWIAVDCDPGRGDFICDFNHFSGFPLPDNSVECIYASHVFEHVSIYNINFVFSECFRILKTDGVLRVIVPNVVRSIKEYLAGNKEFELFKIRMVNLEKAFNVKNPTLFDCLRGDFISMTYQSFLLGNKVLAHQNAWDSETLIKDLLNTGFTTAFETSFQVSKSHYFSFEGTYPSAANEVDRSLYIEAIK